MSPRASAFRDGHGTDCNAKPSTSRTQAGLKLILQAGRPSQRLPDTRGPRAVSGRSGQISAAAGDPNGSERFRATLIDFAGLNVIAGPAGGVQPYPYLKVSPVPTTPSPNA